jgi:hypothetical protein
MNNPEDINKVAQLYNKYCPSLCKAIKLTPKRKRIIDALLNDYSMQDLKQAFQMVEASDFLTGRSKNSTWRCPGFDWVINIDHLVRILEGYYDNPRKNIKILKITPNNYNEYLQTPEWQNIRKEALQRAGYKCQLCSEIRLLHIHHNTYENIGNENPKDLIVLCESCHAKFHNKDKV